MALGFRPIKPAKPIPIKDRISLFFVGRNHIDVIDGAFVAVDAENDEKIVIPIGNVACLLLEPGARLSNAAARLSATVGTLITWVGEGGVRFYSSGQPGGARSDKCFIKQNWLFLKNYLLKLLAKCFSSGLIQKHPRREV